MKHPRWGLGFVLPFTPLEESVQNKQETQWTGLESRVSFTFLQLASQQAKGDPGTKLAHQHPLSTGDLWEHTFSIHS